MLVVAGYFQQKCAMSCALVVEVARGATIVLWFSTAGNLPAGGVPEGNEDRFLV